MKASKSYNGIFSCKPPAGILPQFPIPRRPRALPGS